jgi:2,4-dienoyl-CoA reductase (NADPH2)
VTDQQFKHLFSPFKIGGMTVRNRIVFSAHVPLYWRRDEGPNERARDYYVARAKGGLGMIVLPQNYVAPLTTEYAEMAMLIDKTMSGYRMLSDAIHEHGAKVLGQLTHLGIRGVPALFGGAGIGPSPTPMPVGIMPPVSEVPHEMEIEEIKKFPGAYARAAARMRETGYDGVEISSTVGAGTLLVSFLSPYYNKRKDEYGGSLENRMRLHVEILDAVRKAVGSDFVVGMRLVSDELLDSGLTMDDAKIYAP